MPTLFYLPTAKKQQNRIVALGAAGGKPKINRRSAGRKMNLKKILDTQDEFNSLQDDEKKLYADDGKGKYTRNEEAYSAYLESRIEEQEGLKRNYGRLNEDVKKLRAKAQEYEDAKKKAEDEAKAAAEAKELEARKSANDFEGFKASVQKIHADELAAARLESERLLKIIDKKTVQAEVSRLAAELAIPGCAKLLEPHIRERLRAKYTDGDVTVEVLDEQGRPTAFTIDDLKKEFASSQDFSHIINGSRASGTGHQSATAVNTLPQGGAAPGAKKPEDYTGVELVKMSKENPSDYERVIQMLKTKKKTR